jgi:hypothetical protein
MSASITSCCDVTISPYGGRRRDVAYDVKCVGYSSTLDALHLPLFIVLACHPRRNGVICSKYRVYRERTEGGDELLIPISLKARISQKSILSVTYIPRPSMPPTSIIPESSRSFDGETLYSQHTGLSTRASDDMSSRATSSHSDDSGLSISGHLAYDVVRLERSEASRDQPSTIGASGSDRSGRTSGPPHTSDFEMVRYDPLSKVTEVGKKLIEEVFVVGYIEGIVYRSRVDRMKTLVLKIVSVPNPTYEEILRRSHILLFGTLPIWTTPTVESATFLESWEENAETEMRKRLQVRLLGFSDKGSKVHTLAAQASIFMEEGRELWTEIDRPEAAELPRFSTDRWGDSLKQVDELYS